jgi:hypothetical protein
MKTNTAKNSQGGKGSATATGHGGNAGFAGAGISAVGKTFSGY